MIRDLFARARADGRKVFIAYLTAGDPSFEETARHARALEKAGVDLLELGVAHSDPVADGPVLVRAADRALRAGSDWEKVFALVARLRKEGFRVPILLFTYWNPVARLGAAEFARRARAAGAEGALIVDLPPEEAGEYLAAAREAVLETVFLASPTTADDRLEKVRESSTGFVYVLSRAGITGERGSLDPALTGRLAVLRKKLGDVPLAVGFGISTPEQARAVAPLADGVVVGSALVRAVEEGKDPAALARSLAEAVHSGGPRC